MTEAEIDIAGVNELLECPVCMLLMEPPIYQCKMGHSFCQSCLPRLNGKCPQCRCDFNPADPIRCLVLDEMARKVPRKCKYTKMGCTAVYPLEQLKKHERVCPFTTYTCARVYMYDKSCTWRGPIEDMNDHLTQAHKSHLPTPIKLNKPIRRTLRVLHTEDTAPWPIKILNLEGGSPIYVGSVITNGSFYAFCRSATETVKYSYTATARGRDRFFSYSGPVQPLRYDNALETRNRDCLYISPEALKLIMTEEPRKLSLEITIMEYQQNVMELDD